MARQEPRITNDAETLDEAYETQRVNSLPEDLQRLVAIHHTDQLEAVPCYVEGQAQDFVTFCNALGIASQPE